MVEKMKWVLADRYVIPGEVQRKLIFSNSYITRLSPGRQKQMENRWLTYKTSYSFYRWRERRFYSFKRAFYVAKG